MVGQEEFQITHKTCGATFPVMVGQTLYTIADPQIETVKYVQIECPKCGGKMFLE